MPSLPPWLDPSAPHLLGLSGGRDSTALLHLLLDSGFKSLTACHLNHGLRGPESDADQAFARDLCALKNVPFETESIPPGVLANSPHSLETAARHARHAFFARIAENLQTPRVLLAHHAEDQAETVLFNLFRGSAGLRGMREKSTLRIGPTTLHLLRPLLQTRRKEIDYYLTENHIPYREDLTNAEPLATRNRLRNELFPLLADILGRDPVPPLLNQLEHSTDRNRLLEDLFPLESRLDPQGRLHLPSIRELPPHLRNLALFQFLKKQNIPGLSRSVVAAARQLITPGGPHALTLPGGFQLRRRQGRLIIFSPDEL